MVVKSVLKDIENLFKSLIWDIEVEAGLIALFAAVPWLAVWPLGAIIRAFVHKLADVAYAQIVLFVDVEAIKLVDNQRQNEFEAASITLYQLSVDGKDIGTKEYQEALANAKKSLSRFAHYGTT